jgi:hypothetical protein
MQDLHSAISQKTDILHSHRCENLKPYVSKRSSDFEVRSNVLRKGTVVVVVVPLRGRVTLMKWSEMVSAVGDLENAARI